MTQEQIISIVREKGKVGSTENERYIDLPDGITEQGNDLAQIVHFGDERGLAVYWLDPYDNGFFKEFSKLSQGAKEDIESYLLSIA